ncbi:Sec-independent protein translocase subunit TatA [Lentzea sp. NPDC004789]|jgi:sec-independent protein translocase protein TatA
MGNLGVPELLIIALVIILLFGAKKLPDMARSIGRSAKIFKAETKGLRDEDAADAPAQQPVQQPVQQQLPPAQQPVQQQPQVAQPIEQTSQNKANSN